MPNFKIVNNPSEITLNNMWIPSTKFNSKDRLVDEKGHKVSSNYQGCQYRIIEKRERTFSGLERFERALFGTVAVACTLCLGLFFKSVRNLFTKPKENIRFAVLASAGNLPSQRVPIDNPTSLSKVQSDKETIELESIVEYAPWEYGPEPTSLPENWEKHQAKQNIIVNYLGDKVNIPRGDVYFTYGGKVAIGWHGSYNPPHGMF